MPHFIFIQQISVLNILNMLYNLHFFSSKCRLFHNATLFGFCITHILNTRCAKNSKKKSVAKRLIRTNLKRTVHVSCNSENTFLCFLNNLQPTPRYTMHPSKSKCWYPFESYLSIIKIVHRNDLSDIGHPSLR